MMTATRDALTTWLQMRGKRLAIGLTAAALGLTVQLSAQTTPSISQPVAGQGLAEWLQANAFGIAVLTFHMGIAWREFREHRERIINLETVTLRKDVAQARFDGIDEALEDLRSLRNQQGRPR